MPRPKDSYLIPWKDDERSAVGEGLTRTSNPAAGLWKVDVQFTQGPPMKATIRAITKAEAVKFAQHRHPNARTITVLGKA